MRKVSIILSIIQIVKPKFQSICQTLVRVLVKWGDRAQDPSALELLDLKECNWTYRSYSRPLNAQTFFRQTGKFFSVILPKNDNSSIPVNWIQICHNFWIIYLAKINQKFNFKGTVRIIGLARCFHLSSRTKGKKIFKD